MLASLKKSNENALTHEPHKAGLTVRQQHTVVVHHDGTVVGTSTTDPLAENAVLIELKAPTALNTVHQDQYTNYLKGSRLWLCLRLNFECTRLDIKRPVNRS